MEQQRSREASKKYNFWWQPIYTGKDIDEDTFWTEQEHILWQLHKNILHLHAKTGGKLQAVKSWKNVLKLYQRKSDQTGM